jgi:hypothetical protein
MNRKPRRKGKHVWGKSIKADARELLGPKRTDKQRLNDDKKGK